MAKKILFEIEVENVGAARRIEALREEIKRLNKEIKGASEGSEEYRKLTGQIADAQIEVKELKDQQKALNREFQAAKVPTDSLQGLRFEYAKLVDQIKILSATERQSPFGQQLIANAANVKKEIDSIEQSIGRFTGNVGNYKSAFQGLQGVLLSLGVGFGFSEIIQGNTQLSDSIANVAKTTGLTIEEAEKLAETLKFRDTRTNLADQLQIAEIGGQLGIANQQIEGFTAGVDVLNIALGDQFGNVENLTREFAGLRNVLTDFKTDNAADDILKLGNAVNFLEAEGNATGQSIVDFAGRIAGAGVPLGATTDQIIGLSTTLSELSINPERGATAVSRLLTELARAPQTFAQAIGEPADTFTKLVQTDIVGALSLVSEKIATSSETNTVFAQTLEELGIGSQGAIEVFGKLGGSTDLLRQRIAQAGETLQNTDSITREFEVKNNNAAAAVEKLKNAIIGAFTSDDAQDAIAAIATELTTFVGLLAEIPGFLSENEDEVLALAAAFIYLNRQGIASAVPLLGTVAQNFGLLTTATGRATVATALQTTATNALSAAQAALPFLAVIAGVYAIVKAFEAYEESASASEKAARTLASAQGDIAKESAKEVAAVKQNIETLKFDVDNKEARKKAIDSLVASYPEYLRGIDLEKASIQDLDRLQNQLTDSIIRSVAERRKASAQEEVATRIIEKQLELQRLERTAPVQVQSGDVGSFVGATAVAQQATSQAAQRQIDNINSTREELRKLQDELEQTGRAFDDAFSIGEGSRQTTQAQRDLSGFTQDLAGQFETGDGASKAAEETKKLGNESESTGKKLQGLGSSSKGAKDEIAAQAGSVAALKDQISKLQKQIESTAPGSPALDNLQKQLVATKTKLKDAEKALLASTFESLFGREPTAPTLDAGEQPKLTIVAELEPDAADKLADQAKAAKDAAQTALSAIEFPVEVQESDAEKKFRDERLKGLADEKKKKDDDAKEQAEKEKALNELRKTAAIDTAQNVADAFSQIQSNRLQRETDAALAALDLETQNRIQAAQGNQTKIAAIEKDAANKRAAIEKEAARKRKQIAVREAIINTALAITRALTGAPPPANLILAGVAAAAGAAQLAVINSQEFAEGGIVKRLKPGIIREKQNAPKTAKGDTVLAYLAPGEMVLNEGQQNTLRSLYGQDAFALAGVPGESATRRAGIPAFAGGGVVGIVPQNGFAQQSGGQQVTVDARAEFSGEQIDALGRDMGAIIAAEVARQMRIGLAEGLFDANRRLEREQSLNQNRQG